MGGDEALDVSTVFAPSRAVADAILTLAVQEQFCRSYHSLQAAELRSISDVLASSNGSGAMAKVQYEIVEHDGGWAYRVDDVFSETFPTHADALAAAKIAAHQHEVPGPTENIEFQDSAGRWHEQVASGFDRPRTEVVDTPDIRHPAERRIRGQRNAFGAVLFVAGVAFAIGYLRRLTRRR
jgi:hypothetical protein